MIWICERRGRSGREERRTHEHADAVELRDEDEDAILAVALCADGRGHASDVALQLARRHERRLRHLGRAQDKRFTQRSVRLDERCAACESARAREPATAWRREKGEVAARALRRQ